MHVLDDLATGTVRCVFSPAPLTTIHDLLAWGTTRPDGERVAACEVDATRPVHEVAEELVRSLAKAALAAWPDWYGAADLFVRCDECSLQPALDRLAVGRAAARQRSVLRPWVSRATSLCRTNAPPVVPGFSPAVQLQQLSLAVAAHDLTLVVRALPADEPGPADLLGLARGLEWVSRHAAARVVAVLPGEWAGRAELDGVSWGWLTVDETRPDCVQTGAGFDEPLAAVSPIRGRPHPNSPGEQLMAARLRRDPVLGPLFEYNVPVATVRNSRYQVDLVWFDGKIVVEIDGYRFHSPWAEFANDRHRDYELQLSGYLVLRLTHASVMSDVELAIDKIRDLVTLRAGRALSQGSSA
jgi:very-short-patch-repair endonuclease